MNLPKKTEIVLTCGFKKLRINTEIGVYDQEKGRLQEIIFSLKMHYSPQRQNLLEKQDRIEDAYDYTQAAEIIRQCCRNRHHDLLENLGLEIVAALRKYFIDCISIEVEIEKPQAMPDADSSICSVLWTC